MMPEGEIRATAMLNELAAQRNMALDATVTLKAEIAVKDARIADLEKQIADLTFKDPCAA